MSAEIPVTVEDCFTAIRALATGTSELKKVIDAQFAIIGGTAVAAITYPYASKYKTVVINFPNVIKRQTTISYSISSS
jgi:hypothetical protein